MTRLLVAVAFVSMAAGAAAVVVGGGEERAADDGSSIAVRSEMYAADGSDPGRAAVEGIAEGLKVRPETRKVVGRFNARGGAVELATAQTKGGQSCLIDKSPSGAEGGACSDGPFFSKQRIVFSIASDGGPERFAELYLSGLAAPGVEKVVVLRSDGSEAEVALNRERAFVLASTPEELQRDVVPAGVRAYGRNGKLVESIDIPSLR